MRVQPRRGQESETKDVLKQCNAQDFTSVFGYLRNPWYEYEQPESAGAERPVTDYRSRRNGLRR